MRWNLKHQGISKIFSGDFDVYPESAVMQFNHRLVLEFLFFSFFFSSRVSCITCLPKIKQPIFLTPSSNRAVSVHRYAHELKNLVTCNM